MRKIVGLIGILILILVSTVVFAENNISSTAVVNGEHITITGQFVNITKSIPVTLRVGSLENILYVWQTMTTEDGSFSFGFEMPDNTPSGEYEYRVASDSAATGYTGTIIYNYTQPQHQNIECVASTNGQAVNITGTVLNANQCIPVTLVVGDADHVFYLWQTNTETDGSFDFNFEMPDSASSGIYRYQIRALNQEELYVSSFNYITASRIVCKAKIDGYEVNISGTVVNATESNNVSLTFGDSDKPIYTAETACGEDGKFTFVFTMPNEVQDGEYSWVINTYFENLSYGGIVSYTRPTYQIGCEVSVVEAAVDVYVYLVGEPEIPAFFELEMRKDGEIIHTDTSAGGIYGNGTNILFMMPETADSGEYEMIIKETLNNTEPYYGILDYVNPYISYIECEAEVYGKVVNISGQTINTKSNAQVSIVVSKNGNRVYTQDTLSADDGTFSFSFTMPDTATWGNYTFTIDTDTEIDTYTGSFLYEVYVERQFVNGNVNVTLKNYVPTISGTINCIKGKTLIFSVLNKSDNTVIIEDTITSANGNYSLLYTLPSLITGKDYTVTVSCTENNSTLFSISAEINSSIIIISVDGDIQLADNVKLDVCAQTENSDIINKSTSFTADKSLSITIPNLVANMSCDISLQGYEMMPKKLAVDLFTKLENFKIEWLYTVEVENFYSAGGNLYSYINDSELKLSDDIEAKFIVSHGDYVYFSNMRENGRIYRCKKDGSSLLLVSQDSASWLYIKDEKLYYKDNGNNRKEKYINISAE